MLSVASIVSFMAFCLSATVAQTVYPRCELCGCENCEPGAFPVGNPNGVIPIPAQFLDQAPPGFTEIPCSLLDFAGQSGQIPPDLCNDDLRLLEEFRTICGCPPLPVVATSSPVVAPVASPPVTSEPSASPIAVNQPSFPTANDTCEICGCADCTPGQFPMGNPTGTIPIPPEFQDQAPPGFTVIPCSLLDFAGQSGQIPNDLCTDELRLLPSFREICGCPPLPTTVTAAPASSPSSSPAVATLMPVLSPTLTPASATSASPIRSPTSLAPQSQPTVKDNEGGNRDDDDDDGDDNDKKSGEGYKLDCESNKYERSERSERGKGKGKGMKKGKGKGGEKSCKGMKKKGKGGRGKNKKKSGKDGEHY